jgi:3-isopropylmalate dehydrogenase
MQLCLSFAILHILLAFFVLVSAMKAFQCADGSVYHPTPGIRPHRWKECLVGQTMRGPEAGAIVIGVLAGEGVGPEVIGAALEVLGSVAEATGLPAEIREGGLIGRDAERTCGTALSAEVIQFCEGVFARGGAILNGPGGGRYVYDLRKHFDLFLKISPIRIVNGLPDASRLRPEALRGTDILITRENTGGAYQGRWHERSTSLGNRLAEHYLAYSEAQVRRFLHASAKLARNRRGKLTVVWKEAGVPSISSLWRDCAEEAAATFGIGFGMVDIDLMAYRLIQEAPILDVIAAPNLFGDVLADLAAVLLGSRGLSFSGNYTDRGDAVCQTNHGAAYDLAGTDRANPVGQIFSLAMMLRESFGRWREADAIEEAVRSVWHEGWRTEDVAVHGSRVLGTREMGGRVAERAGQIASGLFRPVRHRSPVA